MRASQEQIERAILDVLEGDAPDLVRRQDIIRRVTDRMREDGRWETADDQPSQSPNGHSLGEANIDWRITRLKERGAIDNPRHGQWTIPVNE